MVEQSGFKWRGRVAREKREGKEGWEERGSRWKSEVGCKDGEGQVGIVRMVQG